MKIALGTAQFGADYGAFNAAGRVTRESVRQILDVAGATGIGVLDTARAYGASEEVLGQCRAGSRFEIVTKCPSLGDTTDAARRVRTEFANSCAALGVSRVYGYLLHDAEDLTCPGVWDALSSLRDDGLATKVGVSGYEVGRVLSLWETYGFDLAQLPANILTPWYRELSLPEELELHTRSTFLQGFLLADPMTLEPRFQPFRDVLFAFRDDAAKAGLTPLQAAIWPLLASPQVSRVLVGIDSVAQLREIIDAIHATPSRDCCFGPYERASSRLTDPRNW